MEVIVAALRDQQQELRDLVVGLDRDGLKLPSRCPGWDISDVLLHVAQTNELAVASLAGRLEEFAEDTAAELAPQSNVDDWAEALVGLQRTNPESARERWEQSAQAQEQAFASCEPSARVQWVAGTMAARSLATTRLSETWIHTVDIASGLGIDLAPTERLGHVCRLVWRTVPYALAQGGETAAGPVAFDLTAPNGTAWTFGLDAGPLTVVRGSALDLCTVAGQRADATDTGLTATGPDAEAVLTLMRTFA